MGFYDPIALGWTPIPATPREPGPDITYYPRTLGDGYGYFATQYPNRAAADFLFDNGIAVGSRTDAENFGLLEKAHAAGFSTAIGRHP